MKFFNRNQPEATPPAGPGKQDLDLYWDPKMAEILEHWGDDNVWNEIQMFFSALQGRVLDIACGTGITIMKLKAYPALDLHGCDISDLLIRKGVEKGIPPEKLRVCDATRMPYADQEFDYSYSIGSLEHFTEAGIRDFLKEARRVTRKASIHMLPTSKSGRDEGWMKTLQSFHNNSGPWWKARFESEFRQVKSIRSKWEDSLSAGYWFVCNG